MENETLTQENSLLISGGEIKMLDASSGKVGGYLVRFGTALKTDLAGDFFTRETDFDLTPGKETAIYFDHGLDEVLKTTILGRAKMRLDDAGVWCEGVIAARGDYEKKFAPYMKKIVMLAGAGKLGWSSGTASHLVEREEIAPGRFFIKRWMLGLDASLTPTPCEPRTQAVSLKSYKHISLDSIEIEGENLNLPSDYIENLDNLTRAHSQKTYSQLLRDFENARFLSSSRQKNNFKKLLNFSLKK